ncbi:MAG: response regulator [Magnetococcales bacterium]|nr:response regulator [Magnetococcales bacterium]
MNKTVLVVEDNPANMKLVVMLLGTLEVTVLQAFNAPEALDLAHTGHPDLILMDIQLPGMDGMELTRILKQDETTRPIPVLALTALALKGDEERIMAAGCDGYIAKPIQYRSFLAIVKQILTPSAPSQGIRP